jgi:uncharacterized protein (TIGR02996 family)
VTTTDPTLRRLLGAVLADPADDTARLVMADVLEEAGGWERAEFIRDQTEWRPGSTDWDLLDRNLEVWCPWFGRHDELGFARLTNYGLKVTHAGGQVTRWAKGFIHSVDCTLADFRAHAQAIFRAHPVEYVRLTCREPRAIVTEDRYGWYGPGFFPLGQPDDLPMQVMDIMAGRGGRYRFFRSRDEALGALSAACVRWGRLLAEIDVPCGTCEGDGAIERRGWTHSDASDCPRCKGTGWVLNTGD